jgi:uncharacterized membrane protein
MSDTGEYQNPAKMKKPPFLVLLVCSFGILGLIAVLASFFTNGVPLLNPCGWGGFIGANVLLMFNAVFRKKRSDIMGEFHAYNLVSWMVSAMLSITIALLFGLILFAWSYFSEVPKGRVTGLIQTWAVVFAIPIAYGWIRWFIANRKSYKP